MPDRTIVTTPQVTYNTSDAYGPVRQYRHTFAALATGFPDDVSVFGAGGAPERMLLVRASIDCTTAIGAASGALWTGAGGTGLQKSGAIPTAAVGLNVEGVGVAPSRTALAQGAALNLYRSVDTFAGVLILEYVVPAS